MAEKPLLMRRELVAEVFQENNLEIRDLVDLELLCYAPPPDTSTTVDATENNPTPKV